MALATDITYFKRKLGLERSQTACIWSSFLSWHPTRKWIRLIPCWMEPSYASCWSQFFSTSNPSHPQSTEGENIIKLILRTLMELIFTIWYFFKIILKKQFFSVTVQALQTLCILWQKGKEYRFTLIHSTISLCRAAKSSGMTQTYTATNTPQLFLNESFYQQQNIKKQSR